MQKFDLTVSPSKICGAVKAPSSKSFAHRILIASFLSGKEVTVKNAGESVDVEVTITALKALGASVTENDGDIIIKRTLLPKKVKIDCKESGSSLRFLMPVVCALGVETEFTGAKRLLERPILELSKSLEENGGIVSGHNVKGKLIPGVYVIDGSVSSQYISGLLLALSYLDGESEIVIKNKTVSKPYIDITISVLKDFGVNILKTESGYKVVGGYQNSAKTYTVEGDWSGSAFILSLGAINGSVSVYGLNLNSVQGDRKILEILEKFGASVTKKDDVVTVKSGNLKGIEVEMDDVPDLIQTVSAVASYAKGVTVISGVDRLKLKESDRISAIINSLSNMSISARYEDDKIIICSGEISGGYIDGGNDHRTVMSGAVIAINAKDKVKISCGEAINKSYPDFISDYKKIGGKIDVDIKG